MPEGVRCPPAVPWHVRRVPWPSRVCWFRMFAGIITWAVAVSVHKPVRQSLLRPLAREPARATPEWGKADATENWSSDCAPRPVRSCFNCTLGESWGWKASEGQSGRCTMRQVCIDPGVTRAELFGVRPTEKWPRQIITPHFRAEELRYNFSAPQGSYHEVCPSPQGCNPPPPPALRKHCLV